MFNRLFNLIAGFFGSILGGLEKKNPEVLIQREKDKLREKIAKANRGLAQQAGLCQRLKKQTAKEKAEMVDCQERLNDNIRAGNQERAAELALQLQKETSEYEENLAQWEEAEAVYKELKEAVRLGVKEAQENIAALQKQLGDVKIAEVQKDLYNMASGIIDEVGGSADTLARIKTGLNEREDAATGGMRVAKEELDGRMGSFRDRENKYKEAAGDALADYMAKQGMAFEGESNTESPKSEKSDTWENGPIASKTMGAATTT